MLLCKYMRSETMRSGYLEQPLSYMPVYVQTQRLEADNLSKGTDAGAE
jgi:hypothetical protein